MKYVLLLTAAALFFSPAVAPATAGVDNSIYAGLLEKHVMQGRVDYTGLKTDEKKLDQYLAVLSGTDTGLLSKTEQLAFYINAYNAFTIKLILSEYPGINSIKEIGSFFSSPWQKKFIRIQDRIISLDHIEHDILRPQFNDPRIHFAINCASKGCPPLRNEPYEASRLEPQLDEQARQFINHGKNNFYRDGTLFLSKIFKWFKEDFNGNPVRFIERYAEPRLKEAIRNAGADIKLAYTAYDWSLNR